MGFHSFLCNMKIVSVIKFLRVNKAAFIFDTVTLFLEVYFLWTFYINMYL